VAGPTRLRRGRPAGGDPPRDAWAFGGIYRWLVILGIVVGLAHVYWPGRAVSPELRRLRVSYLILGVFVLHENLRDILGMPQMPSVEWLGFLIFFGALGFIAAGG